MRTCTSLLLILLPVVAAAQTPESILDAAREKQLERWQGVESYSITRSMAGTTSTTIYQRSEVETDGGTMTVFRPVATDNAAGDDPRMTAEALEQYAQGLEMTGDALSDEVGNELEKNGLPRGLLAGMGGEQWVSADPGVMASGLGAGVRQMAASQRKASTSGGEVPMDDMADFAERAEFVGTETVDGREAFHLKAVDLDSVSDMGNGGEFELKSASLWIDAEEYVPLRMKMDGVIEAEGQQRPVTIEKVQSDYRRVPGSNLYESYRQTMSTSGVMSDAERAEMEKARQELEKFELEMANMPAGQRAMVEQMMGSRIDAMRDMIKGDGITIDITVEAIEVNPL